MFQIFIFSETKELRQMHHQDLLNMALSDASFIINENNLLSYDWTNQQINIDKMTVSDSDQKRLLSDAYFVVVFNQQPIIAGKRILEFSPTSYAYPVLSIRANSYQPNQPIQYALRNDRLGVNQAPYPFLNPDPTIAEAVKQHLRQLGKLVE
ncbi:hypothetical protein Hgul01_00272 [Herpetosiphon gulosus]|uniref:Uncharacterized protein n=2 Tax=Herpetosiphon gulosus TaxID=1973496 RepID=A0ABP9WTM1_9CHLR